MIKPFTVCTAVYLSILSKFEYLKPFFIIYQHGNSFIAKYKFVSLIQSFSRIYDPHQFWFPL